MVDVGRPRAPVDPDLEPRCLLASTGSCRSGDAPAGSRTDTLATCPPRSIPTARSAGQRSVGGGILHPTLLSLHPGVGYRASVLIACNVAWRARCVAALHRGGALSFDWLGKYSRCVVARARLGLACTVGSIALDAHPPLAVWLGLPHAHNAASELRGPGNTGRTGPVPAADS